MGGLGTDRRYEMDWLRNMVILLLFPFHAARVFDVWEPNYVKNAELSMGLSYFVAVIGVWFMALLFLLAGMSTWHALQRRGTGGYARERLRRLLIPFLFGLVVIVPPQGYFARLSQTGHGENYLAFLKSYFTDFSDLTGYTGGFTPGHLWFILYLFAISMAALPLFKRWRSRNGGFLTKRAGFFSRPLVLIGQFVLLTITEALPDPGGKNPFYFFFVFLWGYILCSDERYMDTVDRIWPWAAPAAILSLGSWMALLPALGGYGDFSVQSIILALLRNLAVWLILLTLIGLGRRYLNRPSPWLRYMNEAAYPVYILHQSVMIAIAFFVVRMQTGVTVKFILIMTGAFIASLALYEGILKRLAVTRRLFGIKIKANKII